MCSLSSSVSCSFKGTCPERWTLWCTTCPTRTLAASPTLRLEAYPNRSVSWERYIKAYNNNLQLNHARQALHFWLFFGFVFLMHALAGSEEPMINVDYFFLSIESKTMLLLFGGRWLSCLWPTPSSSREWGSSPLKAACSMGLQVSSSVKTLLSPVLGYVTQQWHPWMRITFVCEYKKHI